MPQQCPKLLPSLIAAHCCDSWRRDIEPAIERGRSRSDDPDFSRSSSSLRLRALHPEHGAIDLPGMIEQVWHDPLRSTVQSMLGQSVALLADQCWARRQFAPDRYPDGHAAHEWHQDGALHFDFIEPYPADALLKMVTCWIALTPSGEDAPGLELMRHPLTRLLPPGELDCRQRGARLAPAAFWRPVCSPGDALVFSGGTLHRTHVAPNMQKDRTSVELRFVAADENLLRLRDECILPLADLQGAAKQFRATLNNSTA